MEMMAWVMTVSGYLNELEDIGYTQLSTNSHYIVTSAGAINIKTSEAQ